MKVHHSVTIKRPIERVFAYVSTLENETRWQPEIKEVRYLEGDSIRAGAIFLEIRETFGRRYQWTFKVTSFEQNRSYCIESISGAAPYRGCRKFEILPGGTRITEEGELETQGIMKLFDPLLALMSRRPLQVAYDRLKELLEAQT